mgnify:FL=1
MAEESKKQKLEDKKELVDGIKNSMKNNNLKDGLTKDSNDKNKHENKHVEDKKETKKEEKKEVKKKKEEAVARGMSLRASKKHCMYICSFIKGKSIDTAIENLEEVLMFKRPIPFKGEIPHRKGKILSGRYPVKVSAMMINVLKGLKGNVIANGLDLDKTRIYFASASWASRPRRGAGGRFKRTHVILKAKEFTGVKK